MENSEDEVEKKIAEFETELQKMMDEFWNRTIYKELSPEILATIPDEQIEHVILDYIDTKVHEHHMKFDVIANMSQGFQLVYSTLTLETQVENGGFNQFFYNSSGQYANMALQSLKILGADDYYEILQEAIEVHMKEKENPKLQDLYTQGTLESFSESYKLTSLGECDDKFYSLGERLGEMRLKFIRSNPHLFIGS